MITKHTKGNWIIKQTKLNETNIVLQTVLMTDIKYEDQIKSHVICDLYGQDTEEGRANAKLLRAAPDLLDALESMMVRFQDLQGLGEELDAIAIRKARKAIKKATE